MRTLKKTVNDIMERQCVQVDILLSTYNGSQYLPELLQSIAAQSYQNWRLVVRDDGSVDCTITAIKDFMSQFPERIVFLQDDCHNLGPSASFSRLMGFSDAKYIMFCDQDDIWLANKIEVTLSKMLCLENKFPEQPLLIHTDLTVVDKNLNTISESFWKYQRINPAANHLNNLLLQNVSTGCTMMINKNLKKLAYPVSDYAIMHDWWIALVASIYSGIFHINCSTILYRQHENNNTGAKGYSIRYYISRLREAKRSVFQILYQGKHFNSRYSFALNKKQLKLVKSFISLADVNYITRLVHLSVYRFRKHGLLRCLGFILVILFIERKDSKFEEGLS